MRSSAFLSHAAFPRGLHQLSWLWMVLIAIGPAIPLPAQDATSPPPQNPAPYVLHLYSRLVELPTMILVHGQKQRTILQPQQINIRLNSGQPFHPTSVRPEGDDPLSISILVDVSGDQANQLSAMQKYFAEWVTTSLRPQDRVTVYALDCNLVQTANNLPADSLLLQKSLDVALTAPLTHGTSAKAACGDTIRLRGAMSIVMNELSQLPGRRTLLLVSGGRDGKSKVTWDQVNEEANSCSVTVFAITPPDAAKYERIVDVDNLTHQSGGFLFSPTPAALPNTLNEIVSLLRTRYILQFPEPQNTGATIYRVFVTVPRFDSVIRPSAITVPIPIPALDHPSTDLPTEAPDPPAPPSATPNR